MGGSLDDAGEAEAVEEGEGAKDAEGGIDDAPVEGDAANGAAEESVGEDKEAGDEAGVEDPDIADGIDEGAEEKDRDDDVGEGEPIGAVGVPRVALAGLVEAVADGEEPVVEAIGDVRRCEVLDATPAAEEVQLPLQREGGDAAGDQREDEKAEDEAVFGFRVNDLGNGIWRVVVEKREREETSNAQRPTLNIQ